MDVSPGEPELAGAEIDCCEKQDFCQFTDDRAVSVSADPVWQTLVSH
jgi:hypothetical protein